MCVFKMDGMVNLFASSKTLDQNLSIEGNKGVFLSLMDFLAAQTRRVVDRDFTSWS